jgi:hypothetical protein
MTTAIRNPDVQSLPPWAERLGGKALAAASRAVSDGTQKVAEAEARLRAAEDGLDTARAADRAAGQAAVEKGDAPPPAAARDAEDTVAEAERLLVGARDLLHDRQVAYLGELQEHLDGLREKATAELDAVGPKLEDLLKQAEGLLERAGDLQVLLAACDSDALLGREPSFWPERSRRHGQPAHVLPLGAADHLAALRASVGAP